MKYLYAYLGGFAFTFAFSVITEAYVAGWDIDEATSTRPMTAAAIASAFWPATWAAYVGLVIAKLIVQAIRKKGGDSDA